MLMGTLLGEFQLASRLLCCRLCTTCAYCFAHYARRDLRRFAGDIHSRRCSTLSTPAASVGRFPATPLPLGAHSLEAAWGVRSPLDQVITRSNGATAMYDRAYSQAVAKNTLALRLVEDRKTRCAEHYDDEVPAIQAADLYHQSCFPYQDGTDVETSTFSQSTATLSLPDKLCGQMPMTLKRSLALRYRPECLWDAGPQHLDTNKTKRLPLARLAEKSRAIISRVRGKLFGIKS